MTIYSTVEEVNQGVKEGVNAAISQWQQAIVDAGENLPGLQVLVARIISKIKERYPEAKWNLSIGQDGSGWALTIYTYTASYWAIQSIAEPIIKEAPVGCSGLYLVSQPLARTEITT